MKGKKSDFSQIFVFGTSAEPHTINLATQTKKHDWLKIAKN